MRVFAVRLGDYFLQEACRRRLAQMEGFALRRKGPLLLCVGENSPNPCAQLGDGLADFIFSDWEHIRLWQLMQSCFDCFSRQEMEELYRSAVALLDHDTLEWGLFAGANRRQLLGQALTAYLTEHSLLDLAGFIRFRLGGYEDYLLAVLTLAADEFFSRQEEGEYLVLLRKYLHHHPGRREKAHLVLQKGGGYNVFLEEEQGFHSVEGGREEGYEDLLVSGIMLLNPQTVVCHQQPGSAPGRGVAELSRIFQERLQFCPGCPLCQKH